MAGKRFVWKKKRATLNEKEVKSLRTAEALVLLFIGFWGVVGSIIIAPDAFPYMRLIVLLVASITFLIAGIAFYRHNRPERLPVEKWVKGPTKLQRIREAFFVSLALFEIISLISLSILSWKVTTVAGIYVITYGNLISILLFALGLLMLSILVRYAMATPAEKRGFF